MNPSKRQLSRFAATFAGGTLLSRVLGLVRDMVLAALIPTVARDAFLFAFKFPNMLRDMLGEGAANAAFVPVLSEVQEKEPEASYREAVSACLSAMLLLFGGLTALGVVLMPLLPWVLEAIRPLTGQEPKSAEELGATVQLLRWTFPYLFFIGLAVFAMAPLFTSKHYATPSWSPVLLNVALIACCLLFHKRFPNPAWALVVGVWLGGIAQLVVMFAAMKRYAGVLLPNFKLGHPAVLKSFWLLGPVILGQATGEVNKMVDNVFAYSLPEGTVTALFYANRLVQLPLSIFGIAVSVAILPTIARAGARGDHGEIRDMLMHGLRQTFFLVAPAMVGLILLRAPLIRLLFERGNFDAESTQRAATALLFYGLGLLSFSWVRVSVQGFYAIQDTKTPVIIASCSMLLNIVLNCLLVGPLGFRGLALSTSISFTLNFVCLYGLLGRRFGALWDAAFLGGLARMAVATAGMGVVTYATALAAEHYGGGMTAWGRGASALLPIVAAVVAYAALCRLLKVPELRQYLEAFRRG